MTNTRNPFRPRPLSFAIASVLTLGAATTATGSTERALAARAEVPELSPMCTPGLEKSGAAGSGLALYELGNGEFVADYALGEDAAKCLKASAGQYTIRVEGQTFNLAGSGAQVLVFQAPVANQPRAVQADSINPALCESYYTGTTGYALVLTNANGDALGGGSLPGITGFSYSPGSRQVTPAVVDAAFGPYIQCYDATSANLALGGDAFFSNGFESGADLRVSFLDASDAPLAGDELVTTIGSNSVYKVRITNAGSSPANGLRIREFLPRAGGYLTPTVSAVGCSAGVGSPTCTTDANGALAVNIASLAAGQSVVYTLERLVAGSTDLPAASGALTAVAAFVDPSTTQDKRPADNARHLRIGLQTNARPVADPKSVSTPEDTAVAVLLSGSDSDGTVQGYAIASQPLHGSLSGSGANRTYTPAADYNGPDSFTYTVIDDRGTASLPATVSITVSALNDAPRYVAGSIEGQGIAYAEGDEVGISLADSFVDPEGSAVTYQLTGTLPAGLSYNGTLKAIVGTIQLSACNTAACNFPLTVTGSDGQLSGQHNVVLTVSNTNQLPVLGSPIVDQVSNEGATIAFDLSGHFSDPDPADSLSFSVTAGALPAGLSLSTAGVVSGTITQTAASGSPYSVTVTANDGQGGTASDSFQWSVNAVNLAPLVVAPLADDTATIGVPKEILGSSIIQAFADPDGDALSIISATGLPPGLFFFPGSGNISGVPQSGSSGTYEITVTVSDGDLDVSDSFNMLVSS